jgi:hypothetical protein
VAPRKVVLERPPNVGSPVESQMDVHYPPLEKFGRYPYWNDYLGRVSTAGEEEWMKNADRFGGLAPEIRDKIRADVEAGRWSPLVGE